MKKVINIAGKEVEAVANAASPYLYRQVFGEDFLLSFDPEKPDPSLLEKMFFIMQAQASMDFREVLKLNMEDFFTFMCGFGAMDIVMAIDQISDLYFGQTKGTADPKGKAG